ncbi:hypothetical protein TNCT_304791 [Trichonephila clavata]|uniref:Uncharacterized protein n=1 Tax=Trichonephila clavata TaxID=2740835 RepID=A0A8X6KHZ2_TRICU|nr:hypothetical protein TNCT_304791 [Trichonephila clavata]
MWFQLALSMDGPVLGILVGMDNLLYFRILDIASLLGKKNGTMFAKCFTNDIVLGNHVLPPTQQYPKQTARVQLVTRKMQLFTLLAVKIKNWPKNFQTPSRLDMLMCRAKEHLNVRTSNLLNWLW